MGCGSPNATEALAGNEPAIAQFEGFFKPWSSPFSTDGKYLAIERTSSRLPLLADVLSHTTTPFPWGTAPRVYASTIRPVFYAIETDTVVEYDPSTQAFRVVAAGIPNRWSPPGWADRMFGVDPAGTLLELDPLTGAVVTLAGFSLPSPPHRLLYDDVLPRTAFVNLDEGGESWRIQWEESGVISSILNCGQTLVHPDIVEGWVYGFRNKRVVKTDCTGPETALTEELPAERIGSHLAYEHGGLTVATEDWVGRLSPLGALVVLAETASSGEGIEGQTAARLSHDGLLFAFVDDGGGRALVTVARVP